MHEIIMGKNTIKRNMKIELINAITSTFVEFMYLIFDISMFIVSSLAIDILRWNISNLIKWILEFKLNVTLILMKRVDWTWSEIMTKDDTSNVYLH